VSEALGLVLGLKLRVSRLAVFCLADWGGILGGRCLPSENPGRFDRFAGEVVSVPSAENLRCGMLGVHSIGWAGCRGFPMASERWSGVSALGFWGDGFLGLRPRL